MLPDTEDDVEKTIQLKQDFIQGTYEKQMNDIPALQKVCMEASISYASVLRRGRGKYQEPGTCFKFSNQELQPNLNSQRKQNIFKMPEKKKQKTSQEKKYQNQNCQLEMKETVISNRFNILSNTDSDELEELKKIKKKDRTDQQTTRYDDLMKLQKRKM